MRTVVLAGIAVVMAGTMAVAQQKKPSPDAYAATEIGGRYVGAEPVYVGGKWIEIS